MSIKTSSYQTKEFLLQNGLLAKVRLIHSGDAAALKALFHRLSPESIYLRTLEYRKDLILEEAKCLVNVDYQKRMAFVATTEQPEGEEIIAVARYSVISTEQPDTAEIGVVIEDRYQNLGLGSYLLRCLTKYAREHGIHAFVGTVSFQNARIMHIIQQSHLKAVRKFDQGAWEIRIDL